MTCPPTLSESITIAEWWKNCGGESIRVMLSSYAGRHLIDLRTWYGADDGRLKPGFCAEARAFAKACIRARELGPISTGDNDNGATND